MKVRNFFCALAAAVLLTEPAMHAAETLRITEFMAANNGALQDEDGDSSDWIEIHNSGATPASLNGWYLTDDPGNLTRWRFPATNIAANGYMVVFASGKDRRTSGAPLHTDFALSSSGDFVALVKPDGTNIVSFFSPTQQVSGVSYGIPVVQTTTTLVASGAVARVSVPANGTDGSAWAGLAFNDSGWATAVTGVGFETDMQGSFTPVTIADSVAEFSGTQGQNNWFYGFWNKGGDANGVYTNSEFVPFPANFWTGSAWDWPAGDPPFTELTADGGRPSANNGVPGVPDQWAVRRYVNEFNGPVTITLSMSQTSDWVYVTQTGTAANSIMYVYLESVGEGYIDDMVLVAGTVPEVGANRLSNGDFESPNLNPWTLGTNMLGSVQVTDPVHGGSKCLKLVSTAPGSSGSSSVSQTITPGLTVGQPYTLSYWYLPGNNGSALVVRFSGNWIRTTPGFCGDGVVARVFVDGTQVYQQTVLASAVNGQFTTPARAGSHIDFVLDAGAANNDVCDSVTFAATVETADPSLATVADSAADWSVTGTQGEKNWFNGYYNKTTDPDQTYQSANFTAFPRGPGPQSATNFWDEEEWDWFAGNPPFTRIGQYWMNPTGTNNPSPGGAPLPQHWAIRRWVSTASGAVTAEWTAFKEQPDQNNLGGGGVTVRLYQNGVQRDVAVIPGGSVGGVRRTVNLTSVSVGDLIDIAVDPTNTDGRPHDDTDKTFVTLTLRGMVSLAGQVQSSLQGLMHNVNASAYLRLPFNVANASSFNSLTLRMKYDDGFIAYLNGVEVARANAPLMAGWNSAATSVRSDGEAINYQEFNLSSALGILQNGANVLAIHGLNASASDGDFLILPQLTATSVTNDLSAPRYFALPTPGSANGVGSTMLGPLVVEATHAPNIPADADPLVVTAQIAPTFNPVNSVRLFYRVMYGGEVNVQMFDDGAHGDGLAGDGTWGATIPATASTNGQMVRYYITATDTFNNSTRFPSYLDPKNSPQYLGTVVNNPALTNPLPVLHFFVQNTALATNAAGTRCSLFWDGEFYDNVEVNLHGQTTAFAFGKRSMNFNLNTGYKIRPRPGEARVKAFDIITTAADKAYMRMGLSFETFRNSGVPTHNTFLVRVQQNNALYGVMNWVEQANDDFLDRLGLNPEGALYKMYFPMTNAYSGIHKQTRKNEPNDDLQALINGLAPTASRRQFMFDNLDIAEVVNFYATVESVQNEDCCAYKNYFLYRDTDRSGEWQVMPWDLDLTLGRTFTGWVVIGPNLFGGYYDTNTYASNRWYSEQRAIADYLGSGQPIFDALWAYPDTQNMFLRRWSTVQEQFLQKSNTHPLRAYYEPRLATVTAQVAPDAALDLALWGTFPPSAPIVWSQPFAAEVIRTNYLAKRRGWIFNTLAFANGGPYLGSQPTNAVILIGDIDYNPSSGNQAQEYVQLRNTNNYSVDISGWKLGGGIQHTFKGGTVIPSNGVMYVSPDVRAFRARTSGPRGGQGLFVQGNYKGQLSARGEFVTLTDTTGRSVATTNTVPMPSPAQLYLRVTEIMYHPAPAPPGLATNADEFEYIELKNTGPLDLDLNGVHFSNGIEFTFGPSGATNLPPGGRVVVVRSLPAFTSRYLGGSDIAGEYAGLLENNGENIRLDDARGEKILDFSYDADWYPITDGFGFSLEVVNDLAPWDSWGLKANWRPSGASFGSPGMSNTPPAPIPPVIISEALTHTDPPLLDSVELFNGGAGEADVSGWFLTDDYRSPAKFRIPDGTIIPGGSYLVLTENDFNSTNPPSPTGFSLSSLGDEVYLFSTDGFENLTGYYHGWNFGAAANGVSFGRVLTSDGREHFAAQTARSLGASNPGPRIGPVVISEIHYHPQDFVGGADNSEDEFVELHNTSAATVPLYDPAFPGNRWVLNGGVSFEFPTNASISAGGFVLVANFNPADTAKLASFRSRFGVPMSVPVHGPFSGQLDNSSDTVRLFKPDAPEAGFVPYVLVEEIDYKDAFPWPGGADGNGATLQRSRSDRFANDPAWWIAGTPTAGTATGSGTTPMITVQPANASAAASSDASLVVVGSGTAPLRYQWRFNGTPIPGATNALLVLPNVQLSQAGTYNAVVYNNAGAAESSNATLTVYLAAYFTQQPVSTSSRAGLNVTFAAQAVSDSPVRYQWRFNGVNINNATNTSLTVSNVQVANEGVYQVVATDSVGPVPSSPATLTIVYEPFFAVQPVSQTVLPGQNVVLSVVVSNGATLPIGYRWRRGSSSIYGTNWLNSYTSFFVVTNAQPSFPNWNVVVHNAALPPGKASSTAVLTFLADSNANGLADNWESTFFGPGAFVDPNEDADGDTMTNGEEHAAGTDPTNPDSFLKAEFNPVPEGYALSFGAVSNRTYTIVSSDSLEIPIEQWTKFIDVNARTNNRVETFLDPVSGTNRYYRVVTPRQY